MGINNFFDCVLLVDKDPINGFFNAQLVSRLGIANSVKTTSNGLEAVEFINQCCFSEEGEVNTMLILLDIHSAAYSGMELLDLVNSMAYKVFEKVEIINLSSSLDQMDTEKAEESKILGFIEKPLTSEKLQKLLDKTAFLHKTLPPGHEGQVQQNEPAIAGAREFFLKAPVRNLWLIR